MRTIQTTLYQFDELSPEAKEKARTWYRDGSASENYAGEDMLKSMEAIFKRSGITLNYWSIGPYSYSYVRFDMGDAGELTGRRATAWLENNLFSGLRMTPQEFAAKRKDYMGYGASYRVGKIKPCPLTGMCYDEDLLEDLQHSIKSGMTLKDAYHALPEKVRQMNEAEIEYSNEDAQVDESITINEYEFTADGKRA